jgi:hypothetical protein
MDRIICIYKKLSGREAKQHCSSMVFGKWVQFSPKIKIATSAALSGLFYKNKNRHFGCAQWAILQKTKIATSAALSGLFLFLGENWVGITRKKSLAS